MREHRYFVYILANRSRTLYTGVASNLEQRVAQHKQKLIPGFTSQYKIDQLVWFEEHSDVDDAIAREKQIKGWTRIKKITLIERDNPHWEDLSRDWYAAEPPHVSS